MYRSITIIFLLWSVCAFSKIDRKELTAKRIHSTIQIDGVLNESFWEGAEIATNFFQHEPENGEPSKYKSEVKLIYTDKALFVGAVLYDDNPKEIMKQLGKRDEIGQTDFFGVSIDPFNDGLNGYTFIVTAANVQFDARQSGWEDSSWDAVWVSNVKIIDKGWVVEMEIPYSALRFPNKDKQLWGMNFVRNVQTTREKSFWNNVDQKIDGFLKQSGVVKGIENVKPPMRLSLTPYVSGYVNKFSENSGFDYSLKGGLDLKYGINESYTLDMMLIPDFGQVESDDEVLNISPFETYFAEKRPFFTEGTEFFNKGEIFYSRRIGTTPDGYYGVGDELLDNEKIEKNPQQCQLINATKISGKGKGGLGIGFLNGMSQKTMATVIDTLTKVKRKVETQPFTNYNVMVVDQSLKNNSYVSLTNTNYYQPNTSYLANVTASQFKFENSKGTYSLGGIMGMSYIDDRGVSDSLGFKYDISIEKINGNFRWEIEQSLANKKFNPNDMGYLRRTNLLTTDFRLNYNIYKPFWKLLNWYNTALFTQSTYFSEGENISNNLFLRTHGTFRNYLSANLWSNVSVGNINDFYESRKPGRVFKRPGRFAMGGFVSPDYRKAFVVDANAGFSKNYQKEHFNYWFGISPMLRVNDHLNFRLRSNYDNEKNNRGYAGESDSGDTIYFGNRDIKTFVNTLNANYVFNSKMALSFRLRHYWRTVDYKNYYTLEANGRLKSTSDYSRDNGNANYFNIDMVYTWNFAPGSELSIVWKQSIANEGDEVISNYFDNMGELFGVEQNNSISFRLVYYIDYLKVRSLI